MRKKTRYAILGGGWRAEFFLLAAKAVPTEFEVTGVHVRDPAKALPIRQKWNVPTPAGVDDLLATGPDFVVLSLKPAGAAEWIEALARRGVPVLTETPPAPDEAACEKLWSAVGPLIERGGKVQVAEQYPFQPLHAARIALARSGRLGPIGQAQASFSHGYHGVAMIRRLLGVARSAVTVRAQRFTSKIVQGPGRAGPPTEEKLIDETQTLATLAFAGGQLGAYDFAGDQHRSWARFPRVIVRGERGEIHNDAVRYLADFRTPIEARLHRVDTGHGGNMEGYAHRGVLFDAEWLYRNPFENARLSDEEIAVATCLRKMAEHVAGGEGFYSLADGLHDHRVGLAINRAAETDAAVSVPVGPWGE